MRCVLLFLLMTVGLAQAQTEFTYGTPEVTWATFKFALDTRNTELFRTCFDPECKDYPYLTPAGFEKFLQGDGQYARSSRVRSAEIEGKQATLSVDFFSFEQGRPFHDNDPIRMVLRDGRWLLTGL